MLLYFGNINNYIRVRLRNGLRAPYANALPMIVATDFDDSIPRLKCLVLTARTRLLSIRDQIRNCNMRVAPSNSASWKNAQ